jgi:hypothetical protein
MYPYQYSTLGVARLRLRYYKRWMREKTHIARCPMRVICTIRVAVAPIWAPLSQLPPDASVRAAFDQIGDALKLLEKCSPFVLRGLARRNICILIDQAPWPEYWPLSNTMHIPISMVVGQWPIVAACSIVHEWTHARVKAAQSYGWSLRGSTLRREEALCAKQQIDFVRRVPAGMFPYRANLIMKIDEAFQSEYWTAEQREKSTQVWRESLGGTLSNSGAL